MNNKNTTLPPVNEDWKIFLKEIFEAPLLKSIISRVRDEIEDKKTVYPPFDEIFNAFNYTPLDSLKVVIIGQDPYHGPNQAHGLCFSVKDGIEPPPSLINIFKEINTDLGLPIPKTGNLIPWAKNGVLLLNAVLSVEKNKAGSHQAFGWEEFTNEIIARISAQMEGLVFLLWGKFALSKKSLIDESRHFILTAPHPSPFSAHNGFFGCRHFSKTNEILKAIGKTPVDWSLA